MPFYSTAFPGLIVIEPVVLKDDRGYFFESYNESVYATHLVAGPFVQDNQSHSVYGVVRGLHYQAPPHAQAKLVRVLNGNIIDCAVDIRTGSPTFGQSFTIELSSENKKQLYIPKGFAHGFSVISRSADVLYKCDAFYSPASEKGFAYDDPQVAIHWRMPPDKTFISGKDTQLPLFNTYAGEFSF